MERDALIEQLERHEGRRKFPYTDTAGKLTIGVGHNLADVGVSEAAIDFILNEDIDACVADLVTFPWFRELDAIRQRVAIDLRFNLGPIGFRAFRRMLAALARKDFDQAAAQLEQSLWYTQVKTRGPRLVKMLRTGLDYR